MSCVLSIFYAHYQQLTCLCCEMNSFKAHRATVNLSCIVGCHRSTYDGRWNKIRTAFKIKHNLPSFSKFAYESTTKGN